MTHTLTSAATEKGQKKAGPAELKHPLLNQCDVKENLLRTEDTVSSQIPVIRGRHVNHCFMSPSQCTSQTFHSHHSFTAPPLNLATSSE